MTMGNIEFGAKEAGVSDLRDPFRADCCDRIYFVIRKNCFTEKIEFEATVEFRNGPTKGEHRIHAESFPELVKKVEVFTSSLTNTYTS